MSNSVRSTPGVNIRDRMKDYVLRTLGWPVIKVELTEAQVQLCIDEAIRIHSEYNLSTRKIGKFWTTANQTTYDLETLIPGYVYIQEVVYNPHISDFFLNEYFNEFFIDDWSRLVNMTDFYIQTMYNEEYLRRTGNEGSWEIYDNKLYLFPPPKKTIPFIVKYQMDGQENDIRSSTWVQQYALAHAKEILGRIRSKYSSVPAPKGDVSWDGGALLAEAKEEKTQLMERIVADEGPPLIITG